MQPMLSSLIKNCEIENAGHDMQMVKRAFGFRDKNGIFYIKHYGTIIFAYDENNKICEADFDCSNTSNKQIRLALEYFDIVHASVINVHDGSKNNYSGPFT